MKCGNVVSFPVGAASVPVASPSLTRTAIAFSVPGTTIIVFKPSAPATNVDGIALVAASGLAVFREEDFGELVRGPWFAFAQGAAQTAVVVEVHDV